MLSMESGRRWEDNGAKKQRGKREEAGEVTG
jgi:hypothetical protein